MRGEPTGPVEKIRETDKTGTKSTFWPDPEIFKETTVMPELWEMLNSKNISTQKISYQPKIK